MSKLGFRAVGRLEEAPSGLALRTLGLLHAIGTSIRK